MLRYFELLVLLPTPKIVWNEFMCVFWLFGVVVIEFISFFQNVLFLGEVHEHEDVNPN